MMREREREREIGISGTKHESGAVGKLFQLDLGM
jgi:hypothetical protein